VLAIPKPQVTSKKARGTKAARVGKATRGRAVVKKRRR